jgi:hypothetical protein
LTTKHHPALVPTPVFVGRMLRNLFVAFLMILAALFMGMWGYHHFEKMSWIDSYVNAAMILSGMGPVGTLNTAGGKIFAGTYALFSGLFFILVVGVIIAPIANRFFKKIHLESTRGF